MSKRKPKAAGVSLAISFLVYIQNIDMCQGQSPSGRSVQVCLHLPFWMKLLFLFIETFVLGAESRRPRTAILPEARQLASFIFTVTLSATPKSSSPVHSLNVANETRSPSVWWRKSATGLVYVLGNFYLFIMITLGEGRGSSNRAGVGRTPSFISVSPLLTFRGEGDSTCLSVFGFQV